jgi:putative peptidoglycan lipid II flippase
MSESGRQSARGAQLVAAGILLSRLFGLVRERAFAHYFGTSDAGDAFRAALRIPNFLQNLFGEGVLSASFIPAYARRLAEGDEAVARRLASAIATLLTLATSVLVILGVLATPLLIDLIAPGFSGEKREATIRLVQVFFPGTGLLVLSAWCLGILNSHRRFFLSYAAPVLWNLAIIGALLVFGGAWDDYALAERVAWGLVVGSALQLLVQLPSAWRLVGGIRPQLALADAGVRQVLANFLPAVGSRGVVQVSAYVDNLLASLLPSGAVSALSYAQTLYLLPISLFGMSVTAAQLPSMSSATGTAEEVASSMRKQLDGGLARISFFIVPSSVAIVALGDVLVGALYQTGAFDADGTRYVWAVLAGYGVGLIAATQARLYASGFYALGDTRTPLKFAVVRVALGVVVGALGALHGPAWFGVDAAWGAVGLTTAASLAGGVELLLLRRALHARVGPTGVPGGLFLRLCGAAVPAGLAGIGVKLLLADAVHPVVRGAAVVAAFGLVYLGLALRFDVPEARGLVRRLRTRFGRAPG